MFQCLSGYWLTKPSRFIASFLFGPRSDCGSVEDANANANAAVVVHDHLAID
jgi:hypothetical protein